MIKNLKLKIKNSKGMSLLEILVAITIFAILGVVMSQAILLTLRGARKSESTLKAKENITYAMAVIERALRNADTVTCPSISPFTRLDYVDEKGNATWFSCEGLATNDSHIASGSAQLTNTDIVIKSCAITCSTSINTNPTVTIDVSAGDKNAVGIENSTFTSSTQILLRSY